MKTIQKTDYYKVAIGAIEIEEGFNVREELTGIDELAQSMAAIGQQTPIVAVKVRGEEKFILTAGHRRLAAIKLANEKYGAKITHVNVMPGSPDEKARTFTMLLDGEGLRPLTNKEMVKGIERLLEMGVDQKEIVRSLSLSKSTAQAYNLVKAAKTPKEVKKMIEDGLISIAKVNSLERKAESKEELIELVNEFVEKGDTERTVKVSADIAKLEAALAIADPTTAKAALVKAIVNKLKSKASAEDIAKLLK